MQASPVKLRRRPSMVIWSVALVVLGGVLGLAIWSLSSTSTEVVAVRAAVDRGELIAADDLVVARVAVDPSLRVVPPICSRWSGNARCGIWRRARCSARIRSGRT